MEYDKADFEFTFEFSMSVFTCAKRDCQKVVETGQPQDRGSKTMEETEEKEPDFIFTYEFSTLPFKCKCGAMVEPHTKILFLNDRQLNLCTDCTRAYLKRFINDLQYTKYTFSIRDSTVTSER